MTFCGFDLREAAPEGSIPAVHVKGRWRRMDCTTTVGKHITALEMAGGDLSSSSGRPKHYQIEGVRQPYPKSGLLAGSSKNQVSKRRQIKCVYCDQHTGLMNVINSQHCNPEGRN